ncbi:phosphatase PAP2 family protein [Nocardia altamirensis]|uniref:phosphatase PAP2 family protein n=1 Tax=Nocardia altamirensis TaxID=472158 RepID=UPI001FE1159F|nr:phosphatase PAP2 family protein [Nocardia altamirensis]
MLGLRQDVIGGDAYRLGGIVLAGAVTAALPLTFPADGGPTALDRAVATPIHTALDDRPGVYHALVFPSNWYVLVPLLLLTCAWFAYRAEWRSAALMLVVPELTAGLNAVVWKPLWQRQLHDYLAYPSGHTVHLVAIATTFIVLSRSFRTRLSTLIVTAVAMLAAAVGMIGLDYHWPTDILGGTAAAIAMVLALTWSVDKVSPARTHSHR